MEEKKNLNENEKMISMVKPMSDYKNTFVLHCKELRPRISTGIWKFDNILNGGLANELYIMGAETSTGKSAFLMSIAQKVAESGIDVLYFALEMGKMNLLLGVYLLYHTKNIAKKRINALLLQIYCTGNMIMC